MGRGEVFQVGGTAQTNLWREESKGSIQGVVSSQAGLSRLGNGGQNLEGRPGQIGRALNAMVYEFGFIQPKVNFYWLEKVSRSSRAVWENFMEHLRNGFWGPSPRLPFLANGSPKPISISLALQELGGW